MATTKPRSGPPALLELHTKDAIHLPGSGYRETKKIILRELPHHNPPKLTDDREGRVVIVHVPAGGDVKEPFIHVIPYENVARMTFEGTQAESDPAKVTRQE